MKWMETPNGKILQPADETTFLPIKSKDNEERMDLVEIFEDNEDLLRDYRAILPT